MNLSKIKKTIFSVERELSIFGENEKDFSQSETMLTKMPCTNQGVSVMLVETCKPSYSLSSGFGRKDL